ncbi:hypothetical protein JCM8547_004179 [Rhodosporidiobolus lusitaniae]
MSSLANAAKSDGKSASTGASSPFKLASLFGGSGGNGSKGRARPGMGRSASSGEVPSWERTPRVGTEELVADYGRKGSDASVRFVAPEKGREEGSSDALHIRQRSSATYSTASRSTVPSSTFYPSPGRPGHAPYPSSATSLPAASLSLARTRSNASNSTASSDYPHTPAQGEENGGGSIVYRNRSSSSVVAGLTSTTVSRKGKEPEVVASAVNTSWRTGMPVLSPPASATFPQPSSGRRTPMPSLIDPRFTFPMRRGGPNGSGSGSGSGHGRAIGLGFGGGVVEDAAGTRRGSLVDPATKGGGMSYIASLGSLPLVDDAGRPVPSYHSYAPTSPTSPDPPLWSSPTLTSPSLPPFSPVDPLSPVTPATTAFGSPSTPATALLPAFGSPTSPKPSKAKTKRRPTFVARRRKSSTRGVSPTRSGVRRRSTASSNGSVRNSRTLHARTASLPNLRSSASETEQYRRPSIPFDTFEPRSARTRSPGHERRSRETLRSTPLVFPSKPSAAAKVRPPPPRPRKSSQRTHTRNTSHNVLAGPCEVVFAHPRVVVVPGSPSASGEEEEDGVRRVDRKGKGKEVVREGILSDEDADAFVRHDDEEDQSSVRRVLRENEASRLERAGWSDSAARTLGYGLSIRLADRDRERREGAKARSAAAEKRRAEKKKVRDEVRRRKRSEAAATESEYETDWRPRRRSGRYRAASVGEAVPHPSPPIPTSFEPFSALGRKLSFKGRSKDRRPSESGAVSDGAGLGIVGALRRRPSGTTTTGTSSTAAEPATPKPVTVRGQPIRHLRTSNSVDSLFDRANVAAGPSGRDVIYSASPAAISTQYGEALTSPPDDQPSPQKSETRKPSAKTQNAFLSLPPHLHHLLRSPERDRFTPSRPPPPIPSFDMLHAPLPVPPVSAGQSRRTSADSTASAARLSLALEEKLRQSQRSSVGSITALPVATTAPLAWQSRSGSPASARRPLEREQHFSSAAEESPRSRALASTRSEGALNSAVSSSSPFASIPSSPEKNETTKRSAGSFASWMTTAEDPFKVQSALQPSPMRATGRPPAGMRRSSSGKTGQSGMTGHSRASSGGSALEMRVEGDFGGLFYSPPRPQALPSRPQPPPHHDRTSSLDTTASMGCLASPPSDNLRIGDVAVSPVETQHRPHSMHSHIAMDDSDEEEELDSFYGRYDEEQRRRTSRRSLEAIFASAPSAPSTSFETAPSLYASATEQPALYESAMTSQAYLGGRSNTPGFLNTSSDTRPSTALSGAAYATADEGASSDFSALDLPELVFPGESPAAGPSLSLCVSSSPPVRPLPAPVQTPWPVTSFAREYLDEYGEQSGLASPSFAPDGERRISSHSGSGSGKSFLQIGEESESMEELEERPAVSPSSFIEDFSPPSSVPASPTLPAFHAGAVPRSSSPTLPRSPVSEISTPSSLNFPQHHHLNQRQSYLSIGSSHFIDPGRASAAYSAGSGSHYSVLNDRLDDFPRPPGGRGDDSASDGDDELDPEEDEDVADQTTTRFDDGTIRFGGAPSTRSGRTFTIRAEDSDEEEGLRRSSRGLQLEALPTVTDRPISEQSFIDVDSEDGGAAVVSPPRPSSAGSWRSFFPDDRTSPHRPTHHRRSSSSSSRTRWQEKTREGL